MKNKAGQSRAGSRKNKAEQSRARAEDRRVRAGARQGTGAQSGRIK
jgi:hypothetical protein